MSYLLLFLGGFFSGGCCFLLLCSAIPFLRKKNLQRKILPLSEKQYEQWCYDHFDGETQADYEDYLFEFEKSQTFGCSKR